MGYTKPTSLQFETATLSDPGRVRKNNEDCVFSLDDREPNLAGGGSIGIYIIADGMGGHRAGEVASAMATRIISTYFLQNLRLISSLHSPSLLIKQSINEANREIFTLASQKPELYSMGTTVTLGFRWENELYLGQVGDSRAYLIRTGSIRQLTQDHSLVAHLVRKGSITSEEARFHPDRGKILRSLGVSCDVDADTLSLTLLQGDVLVFCSDGLTGNVSDREILQTIIQTDESLGACVNLANLANSHGGEDNISIIVVKVKSAVTANSGLKPGRHVA